MTQLIDSQTCEGVGWNPRLYSGMREKTGRFEYWLWTPSPQGGWECRFRTKDRQKAIRRFLLNKDAVLRMQRAASDVCLGLAINDGSGLCLLPEEFSL